MRRLLAPALIAVLALLVAFQPPATAQADPDPMAESLQRKAREVLTALQTSNAEALATKLAPWKTAELEMYHARIVRKSDARKLAWDRLKPRVAKLDPAEKLKVRNQETFRQVSAARMLGLFLGTYRMGTEEAQQLNAQWFAVRRQYGWTSLNDVPQQRGMTGPLSENLGVVIFESIDGLRLTVHCIAEGPNWYVQDFTGEFGKADMNLSDAMATMNLLAPAPNAAGIDAVATHGEQMLGYCKAMARVAFARMEKAPVTLTGASDATTRGANMPTEELQNDLYVLRDTVYGDDKWGALVAEPRDDKFPVLLVLFSWADGKGEFSRERNKESVDQLLGVYARTGWKPSTDR